MKTRALFTFTDWLLANEDELPKGKGIFCAMHIIFIVIMCLWIIGSFFLFRKYKTFAHKLTVFLCYFMMISRVGRMILLWATGTESFVEVWPWHLCHAMAFAFPAFYLTNTKKFFFPILVITFFGGLLTFIFGDYYHFGIFTFLDIESILLHFMMSTVVVSAIATKHFEIKLKESWQIPVVLALVIINASIGNLLCPTKNYLFLRENGLPFNLFPGHSHLYTYAILVLVLIIITYTPLFIINHFKNKKENKYYVIG